MIMGANLGTTVTNTIVSLGHITRSNEYRRAFAAATVHDFFNMIVLLVLFPLEVYTSSLWGEGALSWMAHRAVELFSGIGGMKLSDPIKFITKPAIEGLTAICLGNGIALIIAAILLTFGMLFMMVQGLRALMVAKLENLFDQVLFKTPRRSLFFGIGLTTMVQSSSITTSIAVPLVGAGIISIQQVFPYTMGANIGTTFTSVLAALATGDPIAMTVAFYHVLFNIAGVAMVWPARSLPIAVARRVADLAIWNRAIPVVYILVTFYLLPVAIIWLGS
jgi:sodium-dependent phosphate cotransporter